MQLQCALCDSTITCQTCARVDNGLVETDQPCDLHACASCSEVVCNGCVKFCAKCQDRLCDSRSCIDQCAVCDHWFCSECLITDDNGETCCEECSLV